MIYSRAPEKLISPFSFETKVDSNNCRITVAPRDDVSKSIPASNFELGQ